MAERLLRPVGVTNSGDRSGRHCADVNAKDEFGYTPLHHADWNAHTEIAGLLITTDADVNAKGDKGSTPLHGAAFKGHKEIAELLIVKDAGVNAKIEDSGTPLDVAIRRNHPEIADLLRKHGGKTGEELKGGEPVVEATQSEPPTTKAPDISIQKAAWQGNIEAIKHHIAAGTDVNAKEKHTGFTPLHRVAMYGHKEVAVLLIAEGADVNTKCEIGETPLDEANREDKTETADLLRKHGGKTGAELKAEGK